ncbi:MAG: SDR family oxidoreductase [Actinomycetota bacterium]
MTASTSFDGRVAIVTGSTQGLGEATVRLMAERGAAGIVVVGRNGERGRAVAASLPCPAEVVVADLSEAEAPDRVVAAADAAFGRVDVLVNAAALTVRGSVWDTDAALWDRMLHLNVRAPGLLITAAAKVMARERIAGSIVTIGSVAAHGGQDFLYPYATSKAALGTLTRNAAHALMRHRIRVNLLQPGWMATPGEDDIQRRFHDADDCWLDRAVASRPFGRLIEPDELARTICFLASDESGMLTGAVIDFDQSVIGAGDAPVPTLDPTWGEPSWGS